MTDTDCFLIDSIKKLPVIASQDQEFWLAAVMSCPQALLQPQANHYVSPSVLADSFRTCTELYDGLVRHDRLRGPTPPWDDLLQEVINARLRIWELRVSRLFEWFTGPEVSVDHSQGSVAEAFRIAQLLSLLPLEFIGRWHAHFRRQQRHPSLDEVANAMKSIDPVLFVASVKDAAQRAKQSLVEGYARYVLRIARGYLNSGVEYTDLVQEGLLGLWVAAEKFNFLEHRRFAIFATTWIWQHITRSIANDSQLIRVPVHAYSKRQELTKELWEHLARVGWARYVEDLIASKGLDPEACLPILKTALAPIRIDAPLPQATKKQIDILLAACDKQLLEAELKDCARAIRAELGELPQPQRDVVMLRFGLTDNNKEHTLEEIGERFHLTRERIRQIEKTALESLGRGSARKRLSGLRVGLDQGSKFTEEDLLRVRHTTSTFIRHADCDEYLDVSNTFGLESIHKVDRLLNREFGSRQSLARQNLTIKGQILHAFRGYKVAMHTSDLHRRLRLLYPLERHNETTLYSVMAANPEHFILVGSGVFRLAIDNHAEFENHSDQQITADTTPIASFENTIEDSAVHIPVLNKFEVTSYNPLAEIESVGVPFRVAERILQSSFKLRSQRAWSLIELSFSKHERDGVLQWGAVSAAVDFSSLSRRRTTIGGLPVNGLDLLSLAFLLFCSEIARTQATEGDMWAHVSRALGGPLRNSLFSSPGLPKRQLRDATEDLCRRLNIRHSFGREGEQSWLRTIFLQFGLTRAGFNRLPFWLANNALLPVAVQDLLDNECRLYSVSFASCWQALQRYRWGFSNKDSTLEVLSSNCWIYPEEREAILDACLSRSTSDTSGTELVEEDTSARTLLLPPLLRWTGVAPYFEIRLNKIPFDSVTDFSRYVLTMADQRLPVVRNGSEWRISGISDFIQIDLSQGELKADLLAKGVSVLAEPVILRLTPAPELLNIYDLNTGHRLNLSISKSECSRPVAVIARADLSLSQPSREYVRVFNGEWICWAFRDGLPATLEILDGDLVLWSLEDQEESAVNLVYRDKISVKLSAGWWGEKVTVAVSAPTCVQVRGLRTGDQAVLLSPVESGTFRGKLEVHPGQDYSGAEIEFVEKSRLKRQTVKISSPEINGVALETEAGWIALDSSRDIDIEYFRGKRLLVRLPSLWLGEQRSIEDWVLLEGDHFCHRPRRHLSSLGLSLFGVGAPLTLSVGPYNSPFHGRKLTKSLLNSGVLRWIELGQDSWRLYFRAMFDRNPEHKIWVWFRGEHSPRVLEPERWSLHGEFCEIKPIRDGSPEAFAFSYKGEWLGARSVSPGLSSFARIITGSACWSCTAKWLRWWRVPLLHESLRDVLVLKTTDEPIDTLCSWLIGTVPGTGAVYSEAVEDAWQMIFRSTFWNWRPTGQESAQALVVTDMITGNPAYDIEHCWHGMEPLLASNPLLLAQLAVRGIQEIYRGASASEIQIFLHVLENLVLGLDRGAGQHELRVRTEECLTHAAQSTSVDERFVTGEILRTALSLVRAETVNDKNLRIALGNAPIRKFIALSLLQRTKEWLT